MTKLKHLRNDQRNRKVFRLNKTAVVDAGEHYCNHFSTAQVSRHGCAVAVFSAQQELQVTEAGEDAHTNDRPPKSRATGRRHEDRGAADQNVLSNVDQLVECVVDVEARVKGQVGEPWANENEKVLKG